MNILCIGRCFPASNYFKEQGNKLFLLASKDDFVLDEYHFDYDKVYLDKTVGMQAVDTALAWHQHERIDAICSFNDKYYDLVIAIAKQTQARTILSQAAIRNTKDKSITRSILQDKQLPSASYATVHNAEQAYQFLSDCPNGAILKPLDASASIGVSKVESVRDIDAAIAVLESQASGLPALIEECLVGPEFSVEAYSEAGEHRVLAITQKYKYQNSYIEQGHLMHADLEQDAELEITNYVKQVLNALDIENGPSHSEIILTVNGPILVESHTRVGGDHIHELIHLATGIDVLELSARQILGHSVLAELPEPMPKKQFAAVWFAFPDIDRGMLFDGHDGSIEASELDGVATFRLLKKAEAELKPAQNSFDRLALAVATGPDGHSALNRAQQAIGQLQPKYKREGALSNDSQ